MEYSSEQLNYFRICYIAFNLVPEGLRKIFKQEWDFRYKTTLGEWKDTPKNGLSFYNNESKKSRSKNARYLATIQNGNAAEWDCSCLFFAILYSDSIGTTLSAAIRKEVDDLRQVRNDIAHISEARLTGAEFKNYVGRVLPAFNSLSLPVNDIEEVKNQSSFPTAEVNNLKSQAANLLAELTKAKSVLQLAKNTIKTKEEQVKTLTSDLQVAHTTIETKQEQVEAIASDLHVAQDTIESKEEQVKCLTQEINSNVKSFRNLTYKPSHEIIIRKNDIKRILKKMQELEKGSSGAVSTIYLSGNPGCGKSQLARQLGVELFGKWSFDSESPLVFVETLNAETLETLTDSYITLASELGVTEYTLTAMVSSKEENPKETIQHLKRLILPKIRKFSKWLIIADNVIDLALVRNLLPQTASEDWGNGQVLITTQDSTSIPTCSPHSHHESLSEGMQPDDAVEVLKQISQIADQEQAEQVARVLDYQPLALAAAAFYVRTVVDNGTPNYNWLTYLARLHEGLREATEEPLARASTAYSKTMTTAIAMAINRASESDEVLRETFHFLSLCGSESLPIQAVVYFVQTRATTQTEELIKAKILTSSLILCICEENGELKHLRLHNVVHETMKKLIVFDLESHERTQCTAAAIKVFQCLFDGKGSLKSKEDYTNLHKIASHSQALLENATSNVSLSERSWLNDLTPFITPDDLIDWLCSTANACYQLGTDVTSANAVFDIACNLLKNVSPTTKGELLKARVLTVRGNILSMKWEYKKSLEIFEEALVIYKAIYGEEHDKVADTLQDIGGIYFKMGNNDQTKSYYEKALFMKKNKYGDEHEAVTRMYVSMANFLSETGQQSQAIEFYEKALIMFKKENDLVNLATCLNNMGNAYQYKDTSKSIELHLKSLDIRKNVLGEEHAKVVDSLFNLGLAYNDNREKDMAIEYLQKATKMKKKIYGEEHDAVAVCYKNLANVHRDIGKQSQAIQLFEEELKIRVKIHGEEHESVADCYNSLARVYRDIGKHSQAIKLFEQELKTRVKVYGEEHDAVADCYNNLVSAYKDIGESKQAIEHLKEELKIRVKVHGKEHDTVARCYNRLASIYRDIEEHRQAIVFLEKELLIREKKHEGRDVETRDIACTYHQLATCYSKTRQQDQDQALTFYKRALNIFIKIEGEHSSSVAACYNNLGKAYYKMEQNKQAVECFEKSIEIKRKINSEDHNAIAVSCNNLARVYRDIGGHSQAMKLFKEELKIRVKVHGEEHGTVADCFNNLARAYRDIGVHSQAIEFLEKELKIRVKVHGEEHDTVARCYNTLASVYSDIGDHSQAIELFQKELLIREKIHGEKDEEPHDIACTYFRLATCYSKTKQQDQDQALTLYKRALNIFKKINGEDSSSVAACYQNLGIAYYKMKQNTQAIECFEKSIAIKQKINGEDHDAAADYYYSLARVYKDIGEQSQAIKFFEKTLKIRVKVHGEEHDSVARCYNRLARVHSDIGEQSQAIKLFEEELKTRVKVHGEEHGTVADCYNNLANVFWDIGEHSQGIEFFENELLIREKIHGEKHEETYEIACTYVRLATCYSKTKLQDQDQALKLYKRALNIFRRINGEDSSNVAACYQNLGIAYYKMKQNTQAIECFEKSIAIKAKINSEDHGAAADCYYSLARVYKDIGEHSQAIELFEKKLKIRAKVHGQAHGTDADCYNNLASVYWDIGKHNQAIELFEEELKIRVKVHGEEHEPVADCYNSLAKVYRDIEEHSQAIKFFEKELKIRVKVHGEEHGAVADCYKNLASAYNDIGEHSQAIEHFEEE